MYVLTQTMTVKKTVYYNDLRILCGEYDYVFVCMLNTAQTKKQLFFLYGELFMCVVHHREVHEI